MPRRPLWAGYLAPEPDGFDGDWLAFLDALKAAVDEVAKAPSAGRSEPLERSDFWGSSDNFVRELRESHPGLRVPERRVAPLCGAPFWTPADEERPGDDCPKCGGRIRPGSLQYCPKCQESGFDGRLARQRKLAGDPPPEPRPTRYRGKAKGKKNRRQRRAGGGEGN